MFGSAQSARAQASALLEAAHRASADGALVSVQPPACFIQGKSLADHSSFQSRGRGAQDSPVARLPRSKSRARLPSSPTVVTQSKRTPSLTIQPFTSSDPATMSSSAPLSFRSTRRLRAVRTASRRRTLSPTRKRARKRTRRTTSLPSLKRKMRR
jgi:hypothetical protein